MATDHDSNREAKNGSESTNGEGEELKAKELLFREKSESAHAGANR
jgi:hypothetical protein